MTEAIVRKATDSETIQADWGTLTWYASGKLGNSADMTVGRCVLKPGQENPVHRHPNCSEVLVVQEGEIEHAIGAGRSVAMACGDAITIPPGLLHNARNTGARDAVLLIAFSSADRRTQGE